MSRFEHHVFVCENLRPDTDERGSCAGKHSKDLREGLKRELKERGIRGTVRVNTSGCLDACEFGPTMVVYPEAIWYGGVQLGDLSEIIDSHIVGGKPVERLMIRDPKFKQTVQE